MNERRSGLDRRELSTFPPAFSFLRRRKSKGRRKDDKGGYVDIYDSQTWVVAMSILFLSLLDGLLTASEIMAGKAREANPIMNALLRVGGVYTFFSIKTFMTAFPLAIIVLHKEWKLARHAAHICLLAYFLLALYHVYLLYV